MRLQKMIAVPVMASMAALVTILGATAYACTNLATINISPSAFVREGGATVEITGSSFLVAEEGPSPAVLLHWNGVEGPVLAQAVPDSAGNVSMTVTIPEVPAGDYVLVATQRTGEDVDEYAALARAAFQILEAGEGSVVWPPGAEASGSLAIQSASTDMMALTVAPGVPGLVLLGAGASAWARQACRRSRKIPEPVERKKS